MLADSQSLGGFVWDDARVLLALWRAKTLTGAGAALGVNASTVGRRLDALEAALGARLFDRTPDGVLATAAAERLVSHAEGLEQAALGLANAAQGFERAPEGVVRISAPPGVADHFLAAGLPRLLAKYPKLRLEIDASVGYVDLTRREADLALRALRPTAGDLVAVKIVEEDDAPLAAPALAKRLGTLARTADAPWIGWGRDLVHIPSGRWLAEHVPESAVLLRTSSIGAQISAAEAGLGLVVVPKVYASVRKLVEVPLGPALAAARAALPRESLWLVGHRALREVPRVAAVWDFIVQSMSGVASARTSAAGSPATGPSRAAGAGRARRPARP
jgi:DNA-binding transcriptional LysR family regulator